MKRPRSGRSTERACYHNHLLEAIGRYLPHRGLPLISGDGRVRWTDRLLVIMAILMSWCSAQLQQDAFGEARQAVVSMYRSRRRPGGTLSGLIWDWRRGRGDESERHHLREMLVGLPDRTMLLADAGFTGFDLLGSVLGGGHQFIVRVGRNVHLLRKLGYAFKEHDGIVYLWPQDHRDGQPLVLRLVVVHDGRGAMYLLSSMLDETLLSDRQIASMYRLRWGIEVMYRSLKQTMGKRKMRSDAPDQARVELDWAMTGLWLLGLMAVEQIVRAGHPPGCWSVANALRAVRQAIRQLEVTTCHGGLFGQLSRAVKDRYHRRGPKAARDWPRRKNERPPGAPRIRMAKKSEVRKAQQLRAKEAAG